MADRRFRKVHLRFTVYEETYARIEAYAKLHKLSVDLALSDLIGFGLHGEGIFFDDPSDEETPPAGEQKAERMSRCKRLRSPSR